VLQASSSQCPARYKIQVRYSGRRDGKLQRWARPCRVGFIRFASIIPQSHPRPAWRILAEKRARRLALVASACRGVETCVPSEDRNRLSLFSLVQRPCHFRAWRARRPTLFTTSRLHRRPLAGSCGHVTLYGYRRATNRDPRCTSARARHRPSRLRIGRMDRGFHP
jgi:hypothetical protein